MPSLCVFVISYLCFVIQRMEKKRMEREKMVEGDDNNSITKMTQCRSVIPDNNTRMTQCRSVIDDSKVSQIRM